uniref:Uncharacterized protein n=1 Tax=Phakopsora pachyrhizi TaxID=170000 RepID=A0A0S1MJW9_PHAPC
MCLPILALTLLLLPGLFYSQALASSMHSISIEFSRPPIRSQILPAG